MEVSSSSIPSSEEAASTSTSTSTLTSVASTSATHLENANHINNTVTEPLWKTLFRDKKIVLIGQLLSLLLASSGAANATLHFDCRLSAPSAQAGLVYAVLSLHLFLLCCEKESDENDIHARTSTTSTTCTTGTLVRHHRGLFGWNRIFRTNSGSHQHLQTEDGFDDHDDMGIIQAQPSNKKFRIEGSIKVYFLMAFLDVEANYCIYLAYKYTTLTSISLFDALAIPSAMICSKYLLRRSYSPSHFIGAFICVIGIVVNVLGDYRDDHLKDSNTTDNNDGDDNTTGGGEYPHKVLGDCLAILGGILYGLNDVLAEKAIKHFGGVNEYLGMIGIFGSTVAFIQAYFLEKDAILSFLNQDNIQEYDDYVIDEQDDGGTCSVTKGSLILLACTILSAISYSGFSHFLVISEAALLNLSLLTGDFWAAIFTITAENIYPSYWFWIALLMIVSGVFIYELSPSPCRAQSLQVHSP